MNTIQFSTGFNDKIIILQNENWNPNILKRQFDMNLVQNNVISNTSNYQRIILPALDTSNLQIKNENINKSSNIVHNRYVNVKGSPLSCIPRKVHDSWLKTTTLRGFWAQYDPCIE